MNAPENKFLKASHDVPHAAPFTGEMAGAKHIGQAIPRPNLERLVEGRGQYVDDIELPRMAHVVYWRSPVAHARIDKAAVFIRKRQQRFTQKRDLFGKNG